MLKHYMDFGIGDTLKVSNQFRKLFNAKVVRTEPKCRSCDRLFANDTSFQLHVRTGKCPRKFLGVANDFVEPKLDEDSDFHWESDDDQDTLLPKMIVMNAATRKQPKTTPTQLEVCPICGKSYASVKMHMKRFHREDNYECHHCGFKTRYLNSLQMHMENKHLPKENICDVCGMALGSRKALQNHIITHRKEADHKCEQCGKAYHTPGSLYAHKRDTHMRGEIIRKCKDCGKEFNNYPNLFYHMKTVHGRGGPPKTYTCELCKKEYKVKKYFKKHVCEDESKKNSRPAVKEEYKKYHCNVCSYKATAEHMLKSHLAMHEGTKPYECTECGVTMRWKASYAIHMRKKHNK